MAVLTPPWKGSPSSGQNSLHEGAVAGEAVGGEHRDAGRHDEVVPALPRA